MSTLYDIIGKNPAEFAGNTEGLRKHLDDTYSARELQHIVRQVNPKRLTGTEIMSLRKEQAIHYLLYQTLPCGDAKSADQPKGGILETLLQDLIEGKVNEAIKDLAIDEEKIKVMVQDILATKRQVEIVIKSDTGSITLPERQHYMFPFVVKAMSTGLNIILKGPKATSKTTMAIKACEALNLKYRRYVAHPATSQWEAFGRVSDENGTFIPGFAYDPFKLGWCLIIDEFDNTDPSMGVLYNALSDGKAITFPNGETVEPNPNFRLIMCGNTAGQGATDEYCGRFQMDAATLDRFIIVHVPEDPDLQGRILGIEDPHKLECILEGEHPRADQVLDRVKLANAWFKTNRIQAHVSLRGIYQCKKLLEAGLGWQWCHNTVMTKGLTEDQITRFDKEAY